jgi:prevent-host-death family protein
MQHGSQTEVITSSDARARFYELLKHVESGCEMTITRYGRPIAMLVPIKRQCTPEERVEAIRQWREASKGMTLSGLGIRDLIDEGRP